MFENDSNAHPSNSNDFECTVIFPISSGITGSIKASSLVAFVSFYKKNKSKKCLLFQCNQSILIAVQHQ